MHDRRKSFSDANVVLAMYPKSQGSLALSSLLVYMYLTTCFHTYYTAAQLWTCLPIEISCCVLMLCFHGCALFRIASLCSNLGGGGGGEEEIIFLQLAITHSV